MPHEERQFWHGKAKAAQAEHKRKFPDYAFRPLHLKAKGTQDKRKVREVGPKDMKRCEKIAELLVEGKKGADLKAAIEEFDRYHVPPVVTRFEAPLTARMYRRSSSEPAPDSSLAFLRSSPKSSSRRHRALSSQPGRSRSPSVKPEASSTPDTIVLDVDNVDDSMPPLVLPPLPPSDFSNYSFATNTKPSFDFNPFVFTEDPASYVESCDPLSPLPSGKIPYGMFWEEGQGLCTPNQAHAFDMTPLSIDTQIYEQWPTTPSQLSSPPSTPHDYTSSCISPVAYQPDASDLFPLMQNAFASFNPNDFQEQMLQTTLQPMGYPGDHSSSFPYQPADASSFQSSDEHSSLPSKGAFSFFTHNKVFENGHQDVSFSDYLAQPLPSSNFA
ncbi:hypothetical protein EW146_g6289 [Bondarzewia mesenterica]|uniref:HMG box domain-containing protein n=1 Tax=Bondarzewia mesenterica TaxID=1095465 RepID=A0A4S4LP21_9AGAM|nr:hypothetical protein EW146_g6289 [Bondarzewia mesenterica]